MDWESTRMVRDKGEKDCYFLFYSQKLMTIELFCVLLLCRKRYLGNHIRCHQLWSTLQPSSPPSRAFHWLIPAWTFCPFSSDQEGVEQRQCARHQKRYMIRDRVYIQHDSHNVSTCRNEVQKKGLISLILETDKCGYLDEER